MRDGSAYGRDAAVDAELRALYRALPLGVGFLDVELRFLRVNEALANLNGISPEAHVGHNLADVVGERADALRATLRAVIDTGRPAELELTVRRDGDGDLRTIEAAYFPVTADDGELLGVGAVVRDVSDRREMEEARARLLQDALIARAEAESAQKRADEARKEAERARAVTELAGARIALLAEAGRRMAESIDWESTLRAVARSAVPGFADWTSLTVVEPEGSLRVVAVAHRDPELTRNAWDFVSRYPLDADASSGAARVIRTGRLEVVHDIDPETIRAAAVDAKHLRLLEHVNVRHYAIAPLTTPAGVIGALTFVLSDRNRRFEHEDLELITTLAARAGLHIQNARLYAERSHVADVLQASLRPRELPAITGAEVAARFRPAGDQIKVGGDFYDVFASGDGAWTALIGDVSGKGLEAAAVTALARHTLRTAAVRDVDPATNLALLNRVMCSEGAERQLCTALYARLCPGDDGLDIRFANAGHPSPLLLRRDGAIEVLEGGLGPLVGAFADADYAEATVRLRPGDLLLMYTDGVIEVRGEAPGFGERALRAALSDCAGASADAVVASVLERAVKLQEGRPRDDIALLAVRARPAS